MAVTFGIDAFNLYAEFLRWYPNRYVYLIQREGAPTEEDVKDALLDIILTTDAYDCVTLKERDELARYISEMWKGSKK